MSDERRLRDNVIANQEAHIQRLTAELAEASARTAPGLPEWVNHIHVNLYKSDDQWHAVLVGDNPDPSFPRPELKSLHGAGATYQGAIADALTPKEPT